MVGTLINNIGSAQAPSRITKKKVAVVTVVSGLALAAAAGLYLGAKKVLNYFDDDADSPGLDFKNMTWEETTAFVRKQLNEKGWTPESFNNTIANASKVVEFSNNYTKLMDNISKFGKLYDLWMPEKAKLDKIVDSSEDNRTYINENMSAADKILRKPAISAEDVEKLREINDNLSKLENNVYPGQQMIYEQQAKELLESIEEDMNAVQDNLRQFSAYNITSLDSFVESAEVSAGAVLKALSGQSLEGKVGKWINSANATLNAINAAKKTLNNSGYETFDEMKAAYNEKAGEQNWSGYQKKNVELMDLKVPISEKQEDIETAIDAWSNDYTTVTLNSAELQEFYETLSPELQNYIWNNTLYQRQTDGNTSTSGEAISWTIRLANDPARNPHVLTARTMYEDGEVGDSRKIYDMANPLHKELSSAVQRYMRTVQ